MGSWNTVLNHLTTPKYLGNFYTYVYLILIIRSWSFGYQLKDLNFTQLCTSLTALEDIFWTSSKADKWITEVIYDGIALCLLLLPTGWIWVLLQVDKRLQVTSVSPHFQQPARAGMSRSWGYPWLEWKSLNTPKLSIGTLCYVAYSIEEE